jgi:lysophospholipase L1-like esterase
VTTERSNADAATGASGRPAQPEPFLRGCVWPAGPGAPYPRANPADFSRLPVDTWGTATLPVSVRFEFGGDTDADAVDITYTTRTDDFGYRGPGAGRTFTLFADHECVAEEAAVLGEGTVRLALGGASPERFTVYLPEGMKPTVTSIEAVGGTITPAPSPPRWLCYGDSIAEGWIASGPAGAWPAFAGRRFGLDVVNLGYAGAARGEVVSAEHVAGVPADVISISHGTNCWTRIPHSVDQMRANTEAFLDVVRQGHADTPVVVASPVLRPDAESTPNRLGATLVDLRRAVEEVTQARIDAGDTRLTLVSGDGVLTAEHLPDGIHPGDEGHAILADVFGSAVAAALRT